MPYALRQLYDHVTKRPWLSHLLVLALAFAIGWTLEFLFEPNDEPVKSIKSPHNYWWYFFISGTSTGYGDFFPVSTGGRIGAVIIIVTGLGAGVSLIMTLTLSMDRRRRNRMNGTAQLHDRNHLVVIGYHEAQLKELVLQLRADPKCTRMQVVACFFNGELVGENPNPQLYHVVRWDETALQRANLAHAAAVYVNATTDDQSLVVMVNVIGVLSDADNDRAHVVMGFNDSTRRQEFLGTLNRIQPGVELVSSNSMTMVSDAIQNPGLATIYDQLASDLDDGVSLYREYVPVEFTDRTWTRFDLTIHLLREGYTLLGVAESHAPSATFKLHPTPDAVIKGGYSIAVIGRKRPDIQWGTLVLAA